MSAPSRTTVIISLSMLLLCVLGWLLMQTAFVTRDKDVTKKEDSRAAVKILMEDPYLPRKLENREKDRFVDRDAANLGALQNQRTVRFANKAAMDAFLEEARKRGLKILDSLDRLMVVRVGFNDLRSLKELLDGTEQMDYIFPVRLPESTDGGVQAGAVGFGNYLLQWLGINEDNSSWGKGVKVAVLDTGVTSQSSLGSTTNHFLVDAPENQAEWNGHGTAVASIIHQLAPSATLESWRIADENGTGDSFTLAKAILEAVDAKVNIINISMGSDYRSTLVSDALQVAKDAGITTYASPGNSGSTQVSFPASDTNVVSIAAVEAGQSDVLDFSNRGKVDMAAPGLAIAAAWSDGSTVYFTGTSASSPVAAGIQAILMAGFQNDGEKCLTYIQNHLNDVGYAGEDVESGKGVPNVGRLLRGDTPGYTDVALTANYATTNQSGESVVQVNVQNQGTDNVSGGTVTINSPDGTYQVPLQNLAPGRTQTIEVPNRTGGNISSSVQLSNGVRDMKSSNNSRTNVVGPGK
jgi:Subtilase family